VTLAELWPTFKVLRGAKFFHNGYLAYGPTFCRSATKFGSVRGLFSRHLLPEFRDVRSFTDALVTWCFTIFPCLLILLPEDQAQAFGTSVPSRGSFLRQHNGFLVLFSGSIDTTD